MLEDDRESLDTRFYESRKQKLEDTLEKVRTQHYPSLEELDVAPSSLISRFTTR